MPNEVTNRTEISLDGQWDVIIDRHATGDPLHLSQRSSFLAHNGIRKMVVPSALEETIEDYEGVAWYLVDFNTQVSAGMSYTLQFDAVNYRCELWVNGQAVGFHDGGYNRFSFDVTQQIQDGENYCVLRVITPLILREDKIDGFGADEVPHQRGAITGGIWQSVKLIEHPSVHVSDVFVSGDCDGKTSVELTLQNDNIQLETCELNIIVKDWNGKQVAQHPETLKLLPGETSITHELQVEEIALWELESPRLYTLHVKMSSGSGADTRDTRFGYREFTIEDGQFALNRKPIFLRSAFWEAIYPITLARPNDIDVVRKEIQLAKDAGFQMLRPWRKPLQPEILDLCDEMGMLITAGLPVECMKYWPSTTPMLEHRVRIEVEAAILNARNHASVVIWELFNEILRDEVGRLKHPMSLLARSLDPSRLIVDESGGWWGTGSHAYLPGSREQLKISEVHCYLPGPVSTEDYDFLKRVGLHEDDPRARGTILGEVQRIRRGVTLSKPPNSPAPGELVYMSEVGYGGLTDLVHDIAEYDRLGNGITPDERMYRRLSESLGEILKSTGLETTFENISEFCTLSQEVQADANLRQLEALRLRPGLAGYCLHAFTCADWVYGAGILDIWRNPKPAYDTAKIANAPQIIAAIPVASSYYTDAPTKVSVAVSSSDTDAQDFTVQAVTKIGNETHELLHNKPVKIAFGVTQIAEIDLPNTAPDSAGLINVETSLFQGEEEIAKGQRQLFVSPPLIETTKGTPVTLIDPDARLSRLAPFLRTDDTAPVTVVATADPSAESDRRAIADALDQAKTHGGRVIFLDAPIERTAAFHSLLSMKYLRSVGDLNTNSLVQDGIFPHKFNTRSAEGNWVPVAHVVADPALLNKLPNTPYLGATFGDLTALETVTNLPEDAQVKVWSISYIWTDPRPRNFLGVGDFWSGGDLFSVPHGRGEIVVSCMRLIDRAGHDPVADQMIFNLLKAK